MATILAAKVVSISLSLIASGGIATLSLFDIPELQSQPASRSLPMVRWMFSRGSHTMPQAAILSSAGFAYLAYASLPSGLGLANAVRFATTSPVAIGFVMAALLNLGIAPVTSLMLPVNFELIKMNEAKGGSRSARSAELRSGKKSGSRTAQDSVAGKGQAHEFTDLSGPQERTEEATSAEEDQQVRQLLGRFATMNLWRAAMTGAGGVIGLVTALS